MLQYDIARKVRAVLDLGNLWSLFQLDKGPLLQWALTLKRAAKGPWRAITAPPSLDLALGVRYKRFTQT